MKSAEFEENFMNFGELGDKLNPKERLQMILDAPSLEIAWILAPLKLRVHGEVYKRNGAISAIDTEISQFKVYHPRIEGLLTGKDQRHSLWRVDVLRPCLRLHYYLISGSRPHSSIIEIKTDDRLYLSLLIKAQPFGGLSERRFFCEYSYNKVFGRIIRTASYVDHRGVRISEDYADAEKPQFDHIAHFHVL